MEDRARQYPALIGNLGLLRDTEGQGETPGCGQIAVKKSVPQESRFPPLDVDGMAES